MAYTIEPKIGEGYDVIVCGGGTAGCAAALAAARGGAKTLLIERSFSVGGMLTIGNAGITKITKHYKDHEDYRTKVTARLKDHAEEVQVAGGIVKEYCHRMMENADAIGTDGQVGAYIFSDRYGSQFTMMDMLEEAGVQVLYDTRVCGAKMEGNTVTGVLVFNKSGFVEHSAKQVIDTTGDGDVAVFAGAEYSCGVTEEDLAEGGGQILGQVTKTGSMYRVRGIDFQKFLAFLKAHPEYFAVQRFGIMSLEDVEKALQKGEMAVFSVRIFNPDGSQLVGIQVYNAPAGDEAILLNFDQTVEVSGLDAMAVSNGQHKLFKQIRNNLEVLKATLPGFENARFSHIPDIGIRETRRIKGDYTLTGMDLFEGVDFPDSIGCGGHPADAKHLREDVENFKYENWLFHMPYRIMLPKGIENLLVAGRCVSSTRLAYACIRPTVQCMVLGEAAGTAAAIAVQDNVTAREVDVQKLRSTLVENGAIV